METSSPKPEIDRQKVQDTLARFTMPSEVEKIETVFELDSTGDPSVTLIFQVRIEARIGREEIRRLSEFLTEVTKALLQANIGGFPYTRLEQAA